MYQAKAFLPSDLSLNPLGAARVFWLFCTGGTLGEQCLGFADLPTSLGGDQELPAEMCLVLTLPETRVWPSLGHLLHISPLPSATSPAPHRSTAVWVSWLWQRQNQQGFAAFTTVGAQGKTKSGLRQEEAGEMAQELHNTLPKSGVTATALSLSSYLSGLPLSCQKNYKNYGQTNKFVLLLPFIFPFLSRKTSMYLFEDIKCFCHAELCQELFLLFQICNKNVVQMT